MFSLSIVCDSSHIPVLVFDFQNRWTLLDIQQFIGSGPREIQTVLHLIIIRSHPFGVQQYIKSVHYVIRYNICFQYFYIAFHFINEIGFQRKET